MRPKALAESSYKKDLLNHLIRIDEVAGSLGIQATLDIRGFRLTLDWPTGSAVLHPQFLVYVGGMKQYTSRFDASVAMFVGWRPRVDVQGIVQWDLTCEKRRFKQFARDSGILTPAWSLDSREVMADAIVKRNRSSFAANIRGPFRSTAGIRLVESEGEYFERFIPGTIAKAWFWQGRPVCMELERMPVLAGDGVSSIRELAEQRLRQRGVSMDLVSIESFLAYQGRALGSVLARGETVRADFRYNSPFSVPRETQSVELSRVSQAPLFGQFARFGEALWPSIPPELRRAGLTFTVDAIVDPEGKAWALEVNANPFLHPAIYEPMLRSLVERSGNRAAA